MERGMDNEWRFVKESSSNPEEMREVVWKRTMLSCVCCKAPIKNSTPRCHCTYNNSLFSNTEIKALSTML
jgi:hypothetical protein